MSNSTENYPRQARPGIRKKAQKSCENCRMGKRKCDSARPTCGTCARKGPWTICTFEPRKSANSRKIDLLEKRIAELEQERCSLLSLENPTVSMAEFQSIQPQTSLSLLGPEKAFSAPEQPPTLRNDPSRGKHGEHLSELDQDTDFQVDGMGAVSTSTKALGNDISRREQRLYFGRSSTYNFVKEVQEVLRASNSSSLNQDSPAEQPRRRVAIFDDYVLPPKKEADNLLAIFWKQVYPLYPFLDETEFTAAYQDLWTSECRQSYICHTGGNANTAIDDIPESRRYHVLLNAMFAVSTQFDDLEFRTGQKERGDLFWQRIKKLLQLDFDIFNRPRLTFIQALLYASVYLQSSSELTGACWNLIAIAVRMAQALGLHCHRKWATQQPETSFLRWRTWAGCVLLDRRLATIYGRPPLTTPRTVQSLVPTPLAPQLPTTSDGNQNAIVFLCHSLQLQEHLSDIVTKIYADRDDAEIDNGVPWPKGIEQAFVPPFAHYIEAGNVVAVEAAIASWESQLPDFLRLSPLSSLQETPRMIQQVSQQCVVLRAQSLYAYILASRPFLLRKSNDAGSARCRDMAATSLEAALRRTLLEKGSKTCLDATMELIDLLDLAHRTRSEILPESWYTIFYLYNCGMTLLMHLHNGSDLEDNSYWTRCLDGLRRYQKTKRTALKCIKALEFTAQNCAQQLWLSGTPRDANDSNHTPPANSSFAAGNSATQPDRVPEANSSNLHPVDLPGTDGAALPDLMFDESVDLSWLSTAPFELNPDELIGPLW